MEILRIICDILFEGETEKKYTHSPKNLTNHYRSELKTVYFDELCVGGNYSLLESKIERYKYHSDRHISTDLVEVLSKCVEVSTLFGEEDDWAIIPIPMHWSRYILRGFDHTCLLAGKLGAVIACPVYEVLKTRFRRRQTKLSRSERISNKKNSFFLKSGYTLPSHIILLDDVVSTGATLNEAARILKEGGVEKILCFTLASNAQICQNLSKSSAQKPIT